MPWRIWRWPLYARAYRAHLAESKAAVAHARAESRQTIRLLSDVVLRLRETTAHLQTALEESAIPLTEESDAHDT